MDITDEMHARDERRAKFKKAIDERITFLEEDIPKALAELHRLRGQVADAEYFGLGWSKSGLTAQEWRHKLEAQGTRVESLFKELAALEGGIERRDARTRGWLSVGIAVVALLSTLIQWLFR